jgi:pimeloyl-ACP methyl ester carboxylesterase
MRDRLGILALGLSGAIIAAVFVATAPSPHGPAGDTRKPTDPPPAPTGAQPGAETQLEAQRTLEDSIAAPGALRENLIDWARGAGLPDHAVFGATGSPTSVRDGLVQSAGGARDAGLLVLDERKRNAPGDAHWRRLAPGERLPERIVLLVHGLDEPGSIWDDLAPALAAAGLRPVRFEYPNDQRIGASAELLFQWMHELSLRGVARLDIVAHSMGGLVVRDCLTRDDCCAGGLAPSDGRPAIDRIITVGAPWQGAPMANMQLVSEVREQVMRWFGSDRATPLGALGFLRDGAGEAADDLLPGSAFLTELNSRPWPPGLRLTVIYGEMGGDDARALSTAIDEQSVRGLTRFLGLDEAAARVEAWSAQLGDGVVPVESAQCPGATDVVRLAANHRLMLKRLPGEHAARDGVGVSPAVAPAIPVILDRLGGQ